MQDPAGLELGEEGVDASDLDAAAGGTRQKRLGTGADRLLCQIVSKAPALVHRCPQVQDRTISSEYRKAVVGVHRLKTEVLDVVANCGLDVRHRKRRYRGSQGGGGLGFGR